MRYKIFYIDDESFALPQVVRAIPENISFDFEFVQRIEDIRKEEKYDIVLLDFTLKKDNKNALDIIDIFEAATIIAFSTSAENNAILLEEGAAYAAEKLKGANSNPELETIFKKIFG